MKMTYTDIIETVQGAMSSTGATLKTFAKQRINKRYETVTDKLNTWTQVVSRTFTTGTSGGADQQYYYNPPNLREIESIVLTKDDLDYPLRPVYSQQEWDRLNALTISADPPSRYFRRAADFGIYPTPNEDDYTAVINYQQRAYPLYFEDYVTGTATATENSTTITIASGVTTTFKAGFYFSLADSVGEPRGSWYKILSITDSTHFELETYFEEPTDSASKYIVGQIPETPEETHDLLAIGAIADFYSMKQKDMETSRQFENMFWTGSPNITALQAKGREDLSGLLGAIAAYADRDNSMIVERNSSTVDNPLDFRIPRTATLT